ncbi:uncharacterized protein RAG0_06713 [Rhynchosporium agropyri]|uniref:Uncharacterized protein n=3 Tax=Rhynchosporium TaxID=38037 RepID=A0A1E1M6D7_RHYSE|nr:uncharacterized protein RAG0_06713 [Rhynchosporium agropyri]CZT11428.1 uncharacterized protein RCO7_15137 [Rhynchosporium commune]CZT44671.1 uncharacterized protein RSE6_04871 [Rhynchosporium secalis]
MVQRPRSIARGLISSGLDVTSPTRCLNETGLVVGSGDLSELLA